MRAAWWILLGVAAGCGYDGEVLGGNAVGGNAAGGGGNTAGGNAAAGGGNAGAAGWQEPVVTAKLHAEASHVCASRDGAVWCWGNAQLDESGGLGSAPMLEPVRLDPGEGFAQVWTGEHHACALRSTALWCWGVNDDGRLGLGFASNTPTTTPTRVGVEQDWVSLDGGQNDTCGIRADGTLWCWGSFGEDLIPVLEPTQIGDDRDWISVSTNAFHRCAIKSDQSLWCWGRNVEGQLGLGDEAERSAPTRVTDPPRWSQVSVGRFFVCGLDAENQVWCSGKNDAGQLGQGDQANRNAMTPVTLP